MTAEKIRKSVLTLVTALVLALLIMSQFVTAYAATWVTMPAATSLPSLTQNLSMKYVASGANATKFTFDTSKARGKMVGNYYAMQIKIPDVNKAHTFTNFCTVTFQNAGQIRGRNVNVELAFTKMTVSKCASSNHSLNSDGYMTFASIKSSGFYVSSTTSGGDGYRATKNITVKATVRWADNGQVVNLPFYMGVRDIDATGTYYQESFTAVSGFDSTFYHWPNPRAQCSGSTIIAPMDMEGTSGRDEEYRLAGAIFPTTGGTWTMQYTEGSCATNVEIFSQFNKENLPAKRVDKTTAVEGDIITWYVDQKVGTFYNDMYTKYTSFELRDTLPSGVTYQSARVLMNGSDITSRGSLTHSGNSVTFVLNKSELTKESFYKGQTITLEIKAKVDQPTQPVLTLSNTGSSVVSGTSQNTNTTKTTVKRPNLVLAKNAEQTSYQSYDVVGYTVEVQQETEGLSSKDVVVTDNLPEQLTLMGTPELTGVDGTVDVNGNSWTAQIDQLNYGDVATITYEGKLNEVRTEKEIVNEASLQGSGAPPVRTSAKIRALPIPLDIHVEKIWNDEDDFYELRPDSVEVELLQDGTPIQTMTLQDDDWEGTWTGLPEYKTDTEAYVYTVREVNTPTGYTEEVKPAEAGEHSLEFDIINTLQYYDLNLTKEIVKSDWYGPHGDATFLYEVTSKVNPDWKWYEEITFTKEDAEQGGDTLSKTKTMKLPYGTYTVKEIKALRYDGKIQDTSGTVTKIGDLEAEVQVGTDDTPESITYFNAKTRWDQFSHNDLVINTLGD